MEESEILHILRNPYGHTESKIRTARIEGANLIELYKVKSDIKNSICTFWETCDSRRGDICIDFDTACKYHVFNNDGF